MWTIKPSEIANDVSSRDLFFLEKAKQLLDYNERISNQHRTTCSLTLVHELVYFSELAMHQNKYARRFHCLLDEALDKDVSNSIVNCPVVGSMAPVVVSKLKNIQANRGALIRLEDRVELKKIQTLLERDYRSYIKKLLDSISEIPEDREGVFIRESSRFLSLFLPYALYRGYNVRRMSDRAYFLLTKKSYKVVDKSRMRDFCNYYLSKGLAREFTIYIGRDNIDHEVLLSFVETALKSGAKAVGDFVLSYGKDGVYGNFYIMQVEYVDPVMFIRLVYDLVVKTTFKPCDVREFEKLWDLIYISELYNGAKSVEAGKVFGWRVSFTEDPILPRNRNSTLLLNLSKGGGDVDLKQRSINANIKNALFFYHQSFVQSTIEGSLSYLWIALESLIVIKRETSDIENAKIFISRIVGGSSVIRRMRSFIDRFLLVNDLNRGLLMEAIGDKWEAKLQERNLPAQTMYWFFFLSGLKEDAAVVLFNKIKMDAKSELLASMFKDAYDMLRSDKFSGYCKGAIESSRKSVYYQLDRIYSFRNQIVHSAKFISEYSNIWRHLEWYVAILLLCYTDTEDEGQKSGRHISKSYQIEMTYDNLVHMIERNIGADEAARREHCRNIMSYLVRDRYRFY